MSEGKKDAIAKAFDALKMDHQSVIDQGNAICGENEKLKAENETLEVRLQRITNQHIVLVQDSKE